MTLKHTSFSLEGEDVVVNRLLNDKKDGFYIDIGAFDPILYSNTHMFYLKGWNGINIDARSDSMDKFKRIRSKDINLELAVGDHKKSLNYYTFEKNAINTFDENVKELNIKNGNKILSIEKIEVISLKDILDNHKYNIEEIDFMNIDVEGFELSVLMSNDWSLYSPKFIIIEILNTDLDDISNNDVYKYLYSKSYKLTSRLINSFIFKLEKNTD